MQEVYCVSEESVALDQDASPERTRYRVLLEITDLIAHAKSLPEALQGLAPGCWLSRDASC